MNDRLINISIAKKVVENETRMGILRILLADGLFQLTNIQRITSSCVEGAIPDGDELPSRDQLRTYTLAMIGELYEWMNEFNWKPWKTTKELNTANIAEEFADVLAFLGILLHYMQCVGVSPTDVAEAYVRKTKKNVARFNGEIEGYNGGG